MIDPFTAATATPAASERPAPPARPAASADTLIASAPLEPIDPGTAAMTDPPNAGVVVDMPDQGPPP
jgi:hypothetical protein